MSPRCVYMSVIVVAMAAHMCAAQTTSIHKRAQDRQHERTEQSKGSVDSQRISEARDEVAPVNPQLEQVSLIAIKTKHPNSFELHDILTVIVREQKQYESDGKSDSERRFEMSTEIDQFFRAINGHLGAASFTDGKPEIDVKVDSKIENDGEVERNDKMTFRMAVEIVDIKPNGLLVLSGKQVIQVDDNVQKIAFTGTCRSEDVTADNTILSTQIFDQVIVQEHEGPVKNATQEGWLVRLYNIIKPI